MRIIMKFYKDLSTCLAIITVFCACALAYPSSPFSGSKRPGEIDTLIEELKKELSINAKSNDVRNEIPITRFSNSQMKDTTNFGTLGDYATPEVNVRPLLSALLSKDDNLNSFDVSKRQGSWDYDYGLGGGRFGKRGGVFGDYSLGGGRFGRDVDHVSDFEAENIDFEDITEE